MVDHIISTYGTDAMAAIMDAYRSGATDGEAIEAGTDRFDDIRAEYFAAFGVSEPEPVERAPLGRSDVPLPAQEEPVAEPSPARQPEETGGSQDLAWWLIIGFVVVGVVFFGVVWWRARPVPPSAGPSS